MIKHEIKVELENSDELKNLIKKSYFEEGVQGKIINRSNFIKIDETDETNYAIFKGLNSATVKILNEKVIDGSMRFMVDETQGEVRLYPISIYCIIEDEKYIFY